VALIPDENGTGVAVEIALPDRTVKVDPTVAEEEVKVPLVPFPVSLPEDPPLVCLLAPSDRYCAKGEGRKASKAAARAKWLNKAENRFYFRGPNRDRLSTAIREFFHHAFNNRTSEGSVVRHRNSRTNGRDLPPQRWNRANLDRLVYHVWT
jgi:hypothetical protein